MTYRIIQKKYLFLSISLILVIASVVALLKFGLNFGVDFKGGSLLEGEFISEQQPGLEEVLTSLVQVDISGLVVQPSEDGTFIMRFKETDEESKRAIIENLSTLVSEQEEGAYFKELRLDLVGASIGRELKSKSFNASILVLIMVVLYISYSFRKVSRPVASWRYGLTAIIALAHDIIITLGAFAIFGHYYGVEINTPFIAAILTVLGYSVSDTIVVFDRIRENLPKSSENFENTVNTSINETLGRSVSTSVSTMLALLAILLFGGNTIKDFALALLIGVFVGTYSSLFIASPLIVVWQKISSRKKVNA